MANQNNYTRAAQSQFNEVYDEGGNAQFTGYRQVSVTRKTTPPGVHRRLTALTRLNRTDREIFLNGLNGVGQLQSQTGQQQQRSGRLLLPASRLRTYERHLSTPCWTNMTRPTCRPE
jgi:hypothetical protein